MLARNITIRDVYEVGSLQISIDVSLYHDIFDASFAVSSSLHNKIDVVIVDPQSVCCKKP